MKENTYHMLAEVEFSLLSGLWFMDQATAKECVSTISPDYFSSFDLRDAWEVVSQQCRAGAIEFPKVLAAAAGREGFKPLLSSFEFARLNSTAYCENWRDTKAILDDSKKRYSLKQLAADFISGKADVGQYEEVVKNIAKKNIAGEERETKQHAKEFVEVLSARMSGEFNGVMTPFRLWNDCTAGLLPGTINVLAARPKMGKTAMALQWALHISAKAGNVVYITVEMTAGNILSRVLEQMTGIQARSILKGDLTENQLVHVVSAISSLTKSGFILLEKIGADYQAIIDAVDQIALKRDISAVFVDQLQSMHHDPKRRVFAIGDAIKAIRGAGVRWNVPVVMLAQLARDRFKPFGRPNLASLRDSGEIEQDADTVTFIWRPNPKTSERVLILEANRFGPTGTFALECDFQRCTFTEKEMSNEPTE